MDIGPQQITRRRAHGVFGWEQRELDRPFLVGGPDRSNGSHSLSNLIKYLRIFCFSCRPCLIAQAQPDHVPRSTAATSLDAGHLVEILPVFPFENFVLANQHLPAIIWGFVGCYTLDDAAKRLTFLCGQSISRFRLCGSTVFRRGQSPGEMRGAVSFGGLV